MPSSRALVFAVALLMVGCGLVSGLDSLGVDGGQPDAAQGDGVALDQSIADAPVSPDTGSDGSRGGMALASVNACSPIPGDALSLSNSNFTIELWLQVMASLTKQEGDPVLWRGGRVANEPGWTLVLSAGSMMFCVADSTGSSCTSSYNVTQNDLLHVAVVSTVQSTRSAQLYVRDVTKNEPTHLLRGQLAGGPTTWSSIGALIVGGAKVGTSMCSNTTNIVVDDLRIYNVALTPSQLDSDVGAIACNTAGLVAYFDFDGAATTATDCVNQLVMTPGQGASFVSSPFP